MRVMANNISYSVKFKLTTELLTKLLTKVMDRCSMIIELFTKQ